MPTTPEIDSIYAEIDRLIAHRYAVREDQSLDAIQIDDKLARIRNRIDRLLAQIECCFELLAS